MLKVGLWGSLKPFTGGRDSVEVEAKTIGELLRKLAAQYPGLEPAIERGVSVSVDGVIYNATWSQPLDPKNEIFVLPRMGGG